MNNCNKKNSFQQFKEKINENRKAINAIAFKAEFINVIGTQKISEVTNYTNKSGFNFRFTYKSLTPFIMPLKKTKVIAYSKKVGYFYATSSKSFR